MANSRGGGSKYMKSMALSKYFEIKNPTYSFMKIIPLKSLRNYNSDKLLSTVANIYRTVAKRVHKDNNKYIFERKSKVAYYIYMTGGVMEFYFIIPKDYKNLLVSKIRDVWSGITIEEVKSIPMLSDDCLKYCLDYTKQDVFSLATDKRNNVLLSALCQNMHLLEGKDKVGILYNFIPMNATTWRNDYDRLVEEIKSGENVYKNGSKALIFDMLNDVNTVLSFVLNIVCSLLGEKPNKVETNYKLEMSNSSQRKREKSVVKTQVVVMSESENKQRERNIAMSLAASFTSINEDNEIGYREFENNKINIMDCEIDGADTFISSASEGQNFLSLPGKELIEEYGIDCIDTIETEVPIKLQSGYIDLGTNTYRGVKKVAYLRDNYDQGNLPLVVVGEQGSGKTTFLKHYVNCIQKRGEGCIVIDFIKNCELANGIEKQVGPDNTIVLDLSDPHKMQGFGYNELIPKSNEAIDIIDTSNRKSLYISMLVDAINTNTDSLSSSMDRYLNAASNIVFLNTDASFKDVVRCLTDYKYRNKLIAEIAPNLLSYIEEEVTALQELDECNREGEVVGTKSTKIDGIIHRINLLKKDFRLKLMYQKGSESNIDLVKAMDEGKTILIKMPQEYFSTPYSKNVIVTYFLTKIWSAMLVRGSKQDKPKRFHVIVDEIFQTPTAMKLLKEQEILPQTRKFGCKMLFSCQYLKQINTIDQTLRSAGASYMLLKGSGKTNFTEFKEELSPYTLEDLEAMPQYSSLNLINFEEGRAKFITKLPYS